MKQKTGVAHAEFKIFSAIVYLIPEGRPAIDIRNTAQYGGVLDPPGQKQTTNLA